MAIEPKPGPSTVATIEVDAKRLEYIVDQLESIASFFEARDEMNSYVHLAGVRFSPITIRARELRGEVAELWQEAVADLAR